MEDKSLRRICGMIGFATRAGKTVVGTELICREMPRGGLRLVVISHTASPATKKKLTLKSEFYGIRSIEAEIDTESLGKLLGKSGSVAAVGIKDDAFAGEIIKAVESVN